MSASPDDLKDFYDNGLGPCRALSAVAANMVSTAGTSPADASGALEPGRYLVQCTPPGGTDQVFIDAVPFKKGDTSWTALTAAAPRTPLIRGWIEIVVRKGHNDRIIARCTGAATSTVYVTQLSRVSKKLPPA